MKAKLIRVIEPEKGQPWYLRQYEYECIKCGDLYYRSGYGSHINPYCGKCSYEIEKIRRREQAKTKKIKDINKVLNDIKAEIEDLEPEYDFEGFYKCQSEVLNIIDKHTSGKMLVCPKCGLDVHSDFENCPRCGERMKNETDN